VMEELMEMEYVLQSEDLVAIKLTFYTSRVFCEIVER
jgi:hypothetical protein